MKSVFKEIIIILLLCLAIVVILGVIFYEYIPNNKVVPSTVEAYKTSNSIKNEINQEIVDTPKQTVVLEVTESDLDLYKQKNSYNPGKSNPFASVETTINTNTNTGNSVGQNTNNKNNSNTNSSSEFFNNGSGIK